MTLARDRLRYAYMTPHWSSLYGYVILSGSYMTMGSGLYMTIHWTWSPYGFSGLSGFSWSWISLYEMSNDGIVVQAGFLRRERLTG